MSGKPIISYLFKDCEATVGLHKVPEESDYLSDQCLAFLQRRIPRKYIVFLTDDSGKDKFYDVINDSSANSWLNVVEVAETIPCTFKINKVQLFSSGLRKIINAFFWDKMKFIDFDFYSIASNSQCKISYPCDFWIVPLTYNTFTLEFDMTSASYDIRRRDFLLFSKDRNYTITAFENKLKFIVIHSAYFLPNQLSSILSDYIKENGIMQARYRKTRFYNSKKEHHDLLATKDLGDLKLYLFHANAFPDTFNMFNSAERFDFERADFKHSTIYKFYLKYDDSIDKCYILFFGKKHYFPGDYFEVLRFIQESEHIGCTALKQKFNHNSTNDVMIFLLNNRLICPDVTSA